ncbi:hypothetical protein SRHO_G00049760 [Serrasalmus rhombeus]
MGTHGNASWKRFHVSLETDVVTPAVHADSSRVYLKFSSKLLADGCDAGFLRDEMRGEWKRNSPASFSSPSETLADLLYGNTKRVFDCALTGGKGKRPARIRAPSVTLYDSDLPPTSYVKEMKRCYCEALSQQVEQKREQMERERRRDAEAERMHNETLQFCMWGKPGSGAPNLGSVRRTDISSAGIVPQEQVEHAVFQA